MENVETYKAVIENTSSTALKYIFEVLYLNIVFSLHYIYLATNYFTDTDFTYKSFDKSVKHNELYEVHKIFDSIQKCII